MEDEETEPGKARCPFCFRSIDVTKKMTFKKHSTNGQECPGSGADALGHFRPHL